MTLLASAASIEMTRSGCTHCEHGLVINVLLLYASLNDIVAHYSGSAQDRENKKLNHCDQWLAYDGLVAIGRVLFDCVRPII